MVDDGAWLVGRLGGGSVGGRVVGQPRASSTALGGRFHDTMSLQEQTCVEGLVDSSCSSTALQAKGGTRSMARFSGSSLPSPPVGGACRSPPRLRQGSRHGGASPPR